MSSAYTPQAGWNQPGPRVLQVLLFTCLVLAGGCTDEPPEAEVSPETPSPLCEGSSPRTLDEVYAAHFAASQPTGCTAGCHEGGAGGLSFRNAQELWQATVNQGSTGDEARLRVAPGWPERSQLYLKLLPEAQGRMPPCGTVAGAAGFLERHLQRHPGDGGLRERQRAAGLRAGLARGLGARGQRGGRRRHQPVAGGRRLQPGVLRGGLAHRHAGR